MNYSQNITMPHKAKRAPHRPNGWYNALRFVLWESTALEVMPMCGMVEKVQLAAILQAL